VKRIIGNVVEPKAPLEIRVRRDGSRKLSDVRCGSDRGHALTIRPRFDGSSRLRSRVFVTLGSAEVVRGVDHSAVAE
jgi:hypothetical protein